MDSQAPNVGDRRQTRRQLAQQAIRQRQGIAAAEDDFFERIIPRNVSYGRSPAIRNPGAIFVWILSPETESAMDGANARRYHQRPSVVFVQHAALALGRQIPDRVVRKPLCRNEFVFQWQDLTQQRIAGISRLHAGDVLQGSEHREISTGSDGSDFVFGRQP